MSQLVQLEQATASNCSGAESVDTRKLVAELRRAVEGEVRFDAGSRGLYARDASNYRQVPIGVVIPKTVQDVVSAVEVCRSRGVPILGRGGGTSLAGQCVNVGVVFDFSKYLNQVLQIDPDHRTALVEPGTILDDLRHQAGRHQLTFGPDPATHNHCTLGGMIGNNSCGIHSIMSGRTADNVAELDILTYDGLRMTVGPTSDEDLEKIVRAGGRRAEIYTRLRGLRDEYAGLIRARYPEIPRRVSGYNLNQLLPENGFNVARALVGTESTCVLVLGAKLQLIHDPPHRVLVVLGYPDVFTAGDHVPEIMEHGPIGLEGIDHRLVRYLKVKHLHPEDAALLPDGRGWLLVEFGGDSADETKQKAEDLKNSLEGKRDSPSVAVFDTQLEQQTVWEIRESGLGATAFVPGEHDTWPGWEDSAVAPDRVGQYLRELRSLLEQYGYDCALYGHFGQGCIHTRIDFELKTPEGIAKYRRFVYDAADLVDRLGGSFSGEHGDGQARAELLPKMYGDELVQAFRDFKFIWDPQWRMNPGKIVDPNRMDENLTLGPDFNPTRPKTHFAFAEDGGDLAHATLRCVGVGKCRRTEGGTMCPSYMVTHEEKHTTRGRARLLYEMLQGEVITDGWQSEEVREALDLCLACKGCKGDCPVSVDMATYKSEFLSHYYEHHWRPRSAYAMGLIRWWAKAASAFPSLVNWLGQAPVISSLAKRVGGIALQRDLPQFASETFTSWFARRQPHDSTGPEVILWPDTFNNYFHPEVARAAVHVLEDAGFRVSLPKRGLCCGRPLYDYGLLDRAKALLVEILDALRPQIRQGVCVVGLEPSCLAVFRDELVGLFPHDDDALRLSQQSYLLSEFLVKKVAEYRLPKLQRKAVVHGHCHHKALAGMNAESEILSRLGVDFELLDSGCCGMAGSFGFEQEHYDLSVACGERVLLPAVRSADGDSLIIADGFSCQEQIRQLTSRRAHHLAEVLEMAIAHRLPPDDVEDPSSGRMQTIALCGAGLAVGALAYWGLKHLRSK